MADGSDDCNPSLRLLQHFCCYSTRAKMTSGDGSSSPETSTSDRTDSHVPTIEPIRVTTAEYHEDLEMLVHIISVFFITFIFYFDFYVGCWLVLITVWLSWIPEIT